MKLLAVCVAGSVLLTGCGGDTDSETESDTTDVTVDADVSDDAVNVADADTDSIASDPSADADTDSIPSDPSADSELAIALCANLREKTNALVDVVNDSVARIHEFDEAERSARIRDGYVAARAVLDDWEASLSGLALPDVAEAEQLRAELLTSIDAGRQELDDEAPTFEGPLATIPDDEVRGAVGTWQNSIEKVMSVTEPRIERYDRTELQQAFLDEPTCRHVVQPFRLD